MNSSNQAKTIVDTLAEDTEVLTEYELDNPNVISLDDLDEETVSAGDDRFNENTSIEKADAQSFAGHMQDPDSDDDVLVNAQLMGIGLDETEEKPAELNLPDAVEKAEKEHWER